MTRRVSALGHTAGFAVAGILVELRRCSSSCVDGSSSDGSGLPGSPRRTSKEKLEAGEDVAILDLRTALDVTATPYAIPGSRWISAEALDEHLADIPRDRELVLYCS